MMTWGGMFNDSLNDLDFDFINYTLSEYSPSPSERRVTFSPANEERIPPYHFENHSNFSSPTAASSSFSSLFSSPQSSSSSSAANFFLPELNDFVELSILPSSSVRVFQGINSDMFERTNVDTSTMFAGSMFQESNPYESLSNMELDELFQGNTIDYSPLWSNIVHIISKIHPYFTDEIGDSISKHCRTIHLTSAPSSDLIDFWLSHNSTEINSCTEIFVNSGSPSISMTVCKPCDNDTLDDSFFLLFPDWNSHNSLEKYYFTHCISRSFNAYQDLESYALQFLMVNALHGSTHLRNQSWNILSNSKLNQICSRDAFTGGMVRRYILNALNSLLNGDVHLLDPLIEILDLVLKLVVTGSKDPYNLKPEDDWVAFFEQYSNLREYHISFSGILDSLNQRRDFSLMYTRLSEILTKFVDKFSMVSSRDFVLKFLGVGIFESVIQTTDETVQLKYLGCPEPILLDRKKAMQVENLKNAIQIFEMAL